MDNNESNEFWLLGFDRRQVFKLETTHHNGVFHEVITILEQEATSPFLKGMIATFYHEVHGELAQRASNKGDSKWIVVKSSLTKPAYGDLDVLQAHSAFVDTYSFPGYLDK